uniref:ABC transporter G family member 20 n=1 Tax=Cacopsylla melanoneura TaxID=428564 RepID=A0A8D8T4G3_9HEMI
MESSPAPGGTNPQSQRPKSITLSDLTDRRKQLQSQQSTVQSRRRQAVCVRRACKSYGGKKNVNVVLDNLNMTVAKGCIYGLLGASGCGKTTLLSCIVGRRRLNAGEIWVLGGKPGSKGSGVPGPRIGYMPQEIALYGEFTIRETMIYFGWINGMTTKQVNEKVEFIVNFLQLPGAEREVKNLSGGQQRRVSFAAALLHEPELLILDEPTVGVDPVLRQNIWDYLVQITKDQNTTVIITTHYIDETRQAHMIGLMRGGRFLAEESPDSLLRKHNCESLEDVFLKLSVIQNRGKRRRSSILHEITQAMTAQIPAAELGTEAPPTVDSHSEISGEFGEPLAPPAPLAKRNSSIADNRELPLDLPPEEQIRSSFKDYFNFMQSHHMKALVWKNFLWMWRNVAVMCFIIGLPVAQIILFCLSIGKDPVGLHLAVVNYESNINDCAIYEKDTRCDLSYLSCKYLRYVKLKNQKVDYYETEPLAFDAVRHGRAWGTMVFSSNYTEALKERIELGKDADPEMVDLSDVLINLDESNQQISLLLRRDLVYAFQNFANSLATVCNYSTKVVSPPIRFNHPVYGPVVPNFTDFAAPGVILTIIFFLAVALTSGAMLIERNEGLLERGLVSGVTGIEILTAHVICQFLIMMFQSVMVIVMALFVFDITNHGDVWLVTVLTCLTGLCGMCFGFVVSCVTDSERNATYLAMGSFLPIVMLCGIIWPVQGMHPSVRAISFFLPLTLSTESMRCILAKGWDTNEPDVYFGFLATFLWITVFLTSSVLLIKFRKR